MISQLLRAFRPLSRLGTALSSGRWKLPAERERRLEAVAWAHRVIRGSDPTDGRVLEEIAGAAADAEDLRHRLMFPDPLAAWKNTTWVLPDSPEGRREAVRWAYRTILLREPESVEALDFLASRSDSPRSLRDTLLTSEESRAIGGIPVLPFLSGDEPAQAIEVHVDAAARERLFANVQRTWQGLGKDCPHWSVVTNDAFRPENIGETVDEFYATGERNVATLARTLERNGIDPAGLRDCLDFGCGVGRLSAALAKRFDRVYAVDVSASHLEIARTEFARRGLANVTPIRLEAISELDALPETDLVFSVIVLQHNPPPVMLALLRGLLGRLRPGGVAVIQFPTYMPAGYRFSMAEYETGGRHMEMHALPQREAFAAVREAGAEVLEVLEDWWTGFGMGSRSNTFVIRRPA